MLLGLTSCFILVCGFQVPHIFWRWLRFLCNTTWALPRLSTEWVSSPVKTKLLNLPWNGKKKSPITVTVWLYSETYLGGHRGRVVSRLHRGVHHCVSQQAHGAAEGQPDHQDRMGGHLVEEQSGGRWRQLGEDSLPGMSASCEKVSLYIYFYIYKYFISILYMCIYIII